MTGRTSLTIVLAAGEGTRMRSSTAKILHPVAGQSLLAHVLRAAPNGEGASLAVVIGPDHQAVAEEIARARPDAMTFVQRERLGTAHAVLAARDAIKRSGHQTIVFSTGQCVRTKLKMAMPCCKHSMMRTARGKLLSQVFGYVQIRKILQTNRKFCKCEHGKKWRNHLAPGSR